MKMELLEDLYVSELNEALFAEQKTLQAVPKFLPALRNEDLLHLVERHTQESEQQVKELEKLLKKFDSSTSQRRGAVINALLAEAEMILKMDAEPDIREAALIFAGQKMESNEIACYAGLQTIAKLLTLDQDAEVLGRILQQEKKMSEGLFALAEAVEAEAFEAEEVE